MSHRDRFTFVPEADSWLPVSCFVLRIQRIEMPLVAGASSGFSARGGSRHNANAFRSAVSDAPRLAVEFVRMADVIVVTVQLVSARVGLHQVPSRKTSLTKDATVGFAVAIRSDVAARRPGIDAVGVFPPCGHA